MKKNKKGFTLIELLAVIVVLGIIMTIAGTAVLKQKEKVNVGEVTKMENDIKTFGPDVYADTSRTDKYGKVFLDELSIYGLKTPIKNPNGRGNCSGYLNIEESDNGPVFSGHICCPGLYETGETEKPEDCSNYGN